MKTKINEIQGIPDTIPPNRIYQIGNQLFRRNFCKFLDDCSLIKSKVEIVENGIVEIKYSNYDAKNEVSIFRISLIYKDDYLFLYKSEWLNRKKKINQIFK